MDLTEFQQFYLKLPTSQKIDFLSQLGHRLTVAARGVYPVPSDRPWELQEAPNLMLAINEIMHQITDMIGHLIREEDERYPDDGFCIVLFGKAERFGAMKEFQ